MSKMTARSASDPDDRADFAVDDWLVSPSRNSIRRRGDDSPRTIEPLLIRFLQSLARRPGETVTKDELIEQVWRGLIVSDEAVAQAASRLRRALGDDPRNAKYIETVRKRGYRLAIPVESNAAGRGGRVALTILLALAVLGVLAVILPFRENMPAAGLEPVANDLRDERRSSISPDGQQFAYEIVGADGGTSIWISGGGRDATPMPGTEGGESPVWLSNRMLAMEVRRPAACDIVSYDVLNRETRRIASCGRSSYADLAASPDGRLLAFNAAVAGPAGPHAIHISRPGGPALRLTKPPAGSWGDYDPEFAPDGESILFVRAVSEGQQDLFLADLSGRERRLTRRFGNIFGASWADRRTIVYSARNGDRYGLRRIDVATGRDRPFPLPALDVVRPAIRAGMFLVESRRFQSRLVGGGPDDSAPRWPNSSGLNLHPALSADGRRAVFVSDRSGSLELWVVDLSSGRLRQLTRFGRPFVGAPKFAPDGRTVVYEVRDGDDSDIHLVDLGSGLSRPLVTGRHFDTAPSFSADGRQVYFASDRGVDWNIYAIDPAARAAPSRLLTNAFAAIEAPDGSALYFTRRTMPGLFRRDRLTGAVSIVDARLAIEDWGGFAPVNGGVVYVERVGSGRSRILLALATGEKRLLGIPGGRIPSHDPVLAVRPDRGGLTYVEMGSGAGDLFRVAE